MSKEQFKSCKNFRNVRQKTCIPFLSTFFIDTRFYYYIFQQSENIFIFNQFPFYRNTQQQLVKQILHAEWTPLILWQSNILYTFTYHRTPLNPTQSIARKVHNFNIRNRHLTVTHRSSVKLLLTTCPTATYVHIVYAGHICRIIPSHIINFAANFCTLSCQTRCTRYLLLLS